MGKERDVAKQVDFYRWLQERNRGERLQPQDQIQLEIPEPRLYQVPVEKVSRGVFIIQF